jgi:hypothetical protein
LIGEDTGKVIAEGMGTMEGMGRVTAGSRGTVIVAVLSTAIKVSGEIAMGDVKVVSG